MKIQGPAKAVRIFLGESDRWHGQPLHLAIILRAREMGLAGATAWKCNEGYGAHSRLHTASLLRLSEDLPVIVEIIDIEERVNDFLPVLDEMVTEGLITIEDVTIIKYSADPPQP